MHRHLCLLLLTQLATTGCACLGATAYRPAPIERPVQARFASTNRAVVPIGSETRPSAAFVQAGDAYRNPETAFCLACIVAGGGHLYTGETVKGAALLGVAATGLIGGAVLSSSDDDYDCEYNPETFECAPTGAGRTPLWIGAGIAAGSWIYGILDARASAQRSNARNGQSSRGLEASPWLRLDRGQPGAGIRVRVAW